MAPSSRRSLLAALWSVVGLLTLTSFVIAIVFACASENYVSSFSNNNNDGGGGGSGDDRQQQQQQQQGGGSSSQAISVTSRAMVFAAIWVAVLSGILVTCGTVILGIRMPISGKYYACCRGNVHRMTPVSLGAFGGSLLMFSNLTLVFAILFGEFEIGDFGFVVGGRRGGGDDDDYVTNTNGTDVVYQSSFAFSIMCIFFTVMYAAFAGLIFYNSYALLEESVADARHESSSYDRDGVDRKDANSAPGYIGGDRFGVVGRSYVEHGRGVKPVEVL